jgi:hypothetical protein
MGAKIADELPYNQEQSMSAASLAKANFKERTEKGPGHTTTLWEGKRLT